MVEIKLVELVTSSVLEFENTRNPDLIKQQTMTRYLQKATVKQIVDETIRQRAEQLSQAGIKPIDALHVACAEATTSNYFITCDKRLINRCQTLSIQALNPVYFILEIEDEN